MGLISFTGAETPITRHASKAKAATPARTLSLGVPASIITPEGVPLTAARQWRDFPLCAGQLEESLPT